PFGAPVPVALTGADQLPLDGARSAASRNDRGGCARTGEDDIGGKTIEIRRRTISQQAVSDKLVPKREVARGERARATSSSRRAGQNHEPLLAVTTDGPGAGCRKRELRVRLRRPHHRPRRRA